MTGRTISLVTVLGCCAALARADVTLQVTTDETGGPGLQAGDFLPGHTYTFYVFVKDLEEGVTGKGASNGRLAGYAIICRRDEWPDGTPIDNSDQSALDIGKRDGKPIDIDSGGVCIDGFYHMFPTPPHMVTGRFSDWGSADTITVGAYYYEPGTLDWIGNTKTLLTKFGIHIAASGDATNTFLRIALPEIIYDDPIVHPPLLVGEGVVGPQPNDAVTNLCFVGPNVEASGLPLVSASPPGDDADDDGVLDANDNCPDAPNSGQADADGDGTGDVCDGCPTDPWKVVPGVCGCGIADTDENGNWVLDCIESPDMDGDGVLNESDNCPVAENPDQADGDGDGTGDVCDECPADPDRTVPDACGCGEDGADRDGDGVPDCRDLCLDDPNKVFGGWCGCGNPETDTDGDRTPDCRDACPDDPGKVAPGACGCGAVDSVCGCGSPETDSDGDGVPDCTDECLDDPAKDGPGVCGCGEADGDGDGDGEPDCFDECPLHADETEAGQCGCGVSEADRDDDGVADCVDNCLQDPNASQTDHDDDGLGDACDPDAPRSTTLTEELAAVREAQSAARSDDAAGDSGPPMPVLYPTCGFGIELMATLSVLGMGLLGIPAARRSPPRRPRRMNPTARAPSLIAVSPPEIGCARKRDPRQCADVRVDCHHQKRKRESVSVGCDFSVPGNGAPAIGLLRASRQER